MQPLLRGLAYATLSLALATTYEAQAADRYLANDSRWISAEVVRTATSTTIAAGITTRVGQIAISTTISVGTMTKAVRVGIWTTMGSGITERSAPDAARHCRSLLQTDTVTKFIA